MSTALLSPSRKKAKTLADWLEELGDIPPQRIRLIPPPGTATEKDLLAIHDHEDILCELVDGVLVEKPMAFRESILAVALLAFIRAFVMPRNLGLVLGADGMWRLFPGLIRVPDGAFISWERLPGRRIPNERVPALAPNLAIEVLSESNTVKEIARKLREYFKAGTRLVWIIDPEVRTVAVYTSAKKPAAVLKESATLNGGDVLPGFKLPLKELFAELDRQGSPP